MRTVVFDHNLLEFDVKPHDYLEKYRRLLEEEIRNTLSINKDLIEVFCPGCLSEKNEKAFKKFGFTYRLCNACHSVYVSPRPKQTALDNFYRNSRSLKLWRKKILTETREVRRNKISRPLSQWLLDVIDKYRPQAAKGLVLGYHNDLLLEELKRQEPDLFPIIVTNAIADIEFCDTNLSNITIRPTPVEELYSAGMADVFMVFDYMDRYSDLESLMKNICMSLNPGGLVMANTTLISGFDLQVLWDKSESIYPPERLNLLSTEGLNLMLKRHNFEVLELSTPGGFDMENVTRAIKSLPGAGWPRFIRYLVECRDDSAKHEFQEFLQKHLLSSYGRIALRYDKTC